MKRKTKPAKCIFKTAERKRKTKDADIAKLRRENREMRRTLARNQ